MISGPFYTCHRRHFISGILVFFVICDLRSIIRETACLSNGPWPCTYLRQCHCLSGVSSFIISAVCLYNGRYRRVYWRVCITKYGVSTIKPPNFLMQRQKKRFGSPMLGTCYRPRSVLKKTIFEVHIK